MLFIKRLPPQIEIPYCVPVKRSKSWSGVHATLSQKKFLAKKTPQQNDEDEWKPGQTLWRHDAKNDLKLYGAYASYRVDSKMTKLKWQIIFWKIFAKNDDFFYFLQ